MNLAEYSAQPKSGGGNGGEFIKWTKNGETKVLRFLYTSRDGSDIPVIRKYWSEDEHKFVYDTPEGKLTCTLLAVLYEPGQAPKKVRWERSAAFTEQVCNGYWSKFPRIIDGVWEVTCTNPGTKEIKFSFFPVMGADLTSYPLPEGVTIQDGRVIESATEAVNSAVTAPTNGGVSTTPTAAAATPSARKYWE